MANQTATGAGEGALAGSAAGPWGAIIGGAIGAIGGYLNSQSYNDAAEYQREQNQRAQKLLKPRQIAKTAKRYIPLFRELVAAGVGPQLQAQVAASLGESGLSGTGAGEALRGLSKQAPGIFAFQQALGTAIDVNKQRAGLYANAVVPPPRQNPALAAALGGARGYLSGGGLFSRSNNQADLSSPGMDPRFPVSGLGEIPLEDQYPGLFPIRV